MDFIILPTDRLFKDSPDAGPDCLCSRCGKPILKDHSPPIRGWPEDGPGEYRYHPLCLGFTSAYEVDSAYDRQQREYEGYDPKEL